MNLFYAPFLETTDKLYTFDKDESRHIARVLRKRIGDKLFLTDGNGHLFQSEILDDNPKKTHVNILKVETYAPSKINIHIAMAPTKSNERFEWFLEKATEIGITEITPILTAHSERKKINWARYDKILVAAMKQSLQMYKPTLHPLIKWHDFVGKSFEKHQKLIAYCKAEKHIKKTVLPEMNVLLIIGPEGGFSDEEIAQAQAQQFFPVGLSKSRLRTETAGLFGLAAIHFVND